MKSFPTRYLWRILILAAALLCWYRALILSSDMVKSTNTVSFRYHSGGISSRTVESMLEEDNPPFAAWLQKNGGVVEEREFARDTPVQVLEASGDTELIVPVEELLHGFLPARGDTDTCAIDVATAYALWGGEDATGGTLIYEDREYLVTGVYSRPQNAVIFQTGTEKASVFPYFELYVSGEDSAQRQAGDFIAKYSLPEPDILTNHAETAALLRRVALLPALLVSALLLWRGMRRIMGKPASFLQKAGFVAVMAAGIAVTAVAVGFIPIFPAAVIPSRWSDFSFWSGLFEDIGKRARLNRMLANPAPDLLWWQKQRCLLLYVGGALAGFVIGICRPRRQQSAEFNRIL